MNIFADFKEAGTIADDASEEIGRRTSTNWREVWSKEKEVHREQRVLPGGVEEGSAIN